MRFRYGPALLLLALLIGAAGPGAGQDKKKDDPKKPDAKLEEVKKDDPKKAEAMKADETRAKSLQAHADAAKGEPVSFKSVDGVKLAGVFYKAMEGAKPVVLMLHDYKANPNDVAWADTAKLCLAGGFNVLRFDFRGHGKSTEVVPGDFWVRPENRGLVSGGTGANVAAKTTIKVTEFKPNYFPMLVQDIAAARNYLDQLNDSGDVNTSTVYLLGAGDAAGLGFLYMASEWSRERQKPNLPVPPQYVSLRRALFPASEPAGPDIGGAVWLGPTRNPSIPLQSLKDWCINSATIELRAQTRMLFLHGDKDPKSTAFSKQLFGDVLLIDKKTLPNGGSLVKPDFTTFIRDIKGSSAGGTKLLGNNLGTEKLLSTFLKDIDRDRSAKTRKNRDWDKPLWINVADYGVCY